MWLVFTTGLITGGITCLAVQGGLLASTVAARKRETGGTEEGTRTGGDATAVGVFLAAKLAVHVFFGVLLGWLGSVVSLSPQTQALMMIAVAVYMIGVSGAMLDVHPVFRYFLIQPPRFLTRFIRRQSKSENLFAPAVLGGMTVFIPCGTTQAMMALALGTAHPVYGGLVLGTFVLGTSPLFFILGLSLARLGDMFKARFAKIAAVLLAGVALWNLNNGLVLSGSPFTAQKLLARAECAISFCPNNVLSATNEPATEVTIEFTSRGYVANRSAIKAGETINVKLENNGATGCIQAFTIPSLGIQKIVPTGRTELISFRAPTTPGELNFSCSMGMYGGSLRII